MTEFGKFMKHYRIDKDLTGADMAEKIGCSRAYLSAMETGVKKITSKFLDKITENFDFSDDEKSKLFELAVARFGKIEISLDDLSQKSQNLVILFYHKLRTLSKDQRFYLEKVLNGEGLDRFDEIYKEE